MTDDDEFFINKIDVFDDLRNQEGGMALAKLGGHWLPVFFPLFWNEVRNFAVQPNDIFICTFPKTGTNWVNYLVYMIETGNIDETKADFNFSFLEMPKRRSVQTELEMLRSDTNSLRACTHLPAGLLPATVFEGRVIYVYRNVKDTAVSSYHNYMNLALTPAQTYNDTFENFIRRFMRGEILAGPYEKHLKSYLDAKIAGNPILFLKYEELKNDFLGSIKRIAEFLGKNLDDGIIKQIAEASSVDKMRKNDAVNWSSMRKSGKWNPNEEFIRKGEIGDWRNHFTDTGLLAEFDEYVRNSYPMELFPDYE